MVSGGARARSGPAPDPNSKRSATRESDWTTLPQSCDIPAPDWPLEDFSGRESELWLELWTRPQANMWHRLHLADEVALYVRYFAESESESSTAARNLVRQHREMLGLSTAGMARLMWKISFDEVEEKRDEPAVKSGRDRLKALQGGA